MNKIKKIITVCSALILVGLSAFTTSATENNKTIKSATNNFYPAEIEVAVREKGGNSENAEKNNNPTLENEFVWSVSEDKKTYTAKKEVSVQNVNTISNPTSAFIRICLVPRYTANVTIADNSTVAVDVTNNNGITQPGSYPEKIDGNTFSMGDVTFTLDEKWSDNFIYKNGYFYCKNVVIAGTSTPLLLTSVSISKDKYDALAEKGISFNLDVLTDSIQTEGNDAGEVSAVATRWGDPDTLGIKVTTDDSGKIILQEVILND